MSATQVTTELQKANESGPSEQKEADPRPEGEVDQEMAPAEDHPLSPEAATAASTSKATVSTSTAPPRRPTTRSQTGTVAKRRTRDDDHLVETKKRAAPARKRQKISAPSTTAAGDSTGSQTQGSSSSPRPPPTREASMSARSASSTPALPSTEEQQTQLTFYHSSMSESDQPQSRLPRSRASLPTPIPNLTKKSRGRRVPTKDATTSANPVDPDQKDNRLYVCTVEGCGKCFHRGEHLKRHIRSIHTHEKPFKCTFPLCEKFFNRHDNLLQHLKVHRQATALPDHPPTVPKRALHDEPGYHGGASAPLPHHHRRQRSFSPNGDEEEEEEEEEEGERPSSPPARPRTIYDAYPQRFGSFSGAPSVSTTPVPFSAPVVGGGGGGGSVSGSGNASGSGVNGAATHGTLGSNEPMSLLTNVAVSSLRMEVSSLRTEIQSPVDMRAGGGPPVLAAGG